DLLDLQTDLAEVDVEVLQDVGGNAGALLDEAQQDVLGADVFVVEALGLLVGQLHHLAGAVGKAFIHLSRLRFSLSTVSIRPPASREGWLSVKVRSSPGLLSHRGAKALVRPTGVKWSTKVASPRTLPNCSGAGEMNQGGQEARPAGAAGR